MRSTVKLINTHFYFLKISEVQIPVDTDPSFWIYLLIPQIWEINSMSLYVSTMQFKHSYAVCLPEIQYFIVHTLFIIINVILWTSPIWFSFIPESSEILNINQYLKMRPLGVGEKSKFLLSQFSPVRKALQPQILIV